MGCKKKKFDNKYFTTNINLARAESPQMLTLRCLKKELSATACHE